MILTDARRERFAYWQSIPLGRQLYLMGAAFALFTTVGLLSNMIGASGRVHLVNGFSWAMLSGAIAVLYIVNLARKPGFILFVVPLQLALQFGLSRLLVVVTSRDIFPVVAYRRAIQIDSVLALVFTALAYTLFLVFIQTEGRRAFRAQTELALAHGIQQTLVPVVDTVIAGCAIYGISVPSEKVGGDLVDVVAREDGSGFAYLADIAGHGLQAGILMGMVKTSVRTALFDRPAPAALFARLNRVLPAVKEAHMYATCAALELRPDGKGSVRVEYALAGQPPILHLSADRHDLLSDQQLPIGLFPEALYNSKSVTAVAGDLFVIATDGVLEVCNRDGDEFGIPRLEAIVSGDRTAALPYLAARILEAVKAFGAQEDDQTLLIIRVL